MLKKLDAEKPAPPPVAPYEPTPEEQVAIANNAARAKKRSRLVPLKVLSVENGTASIQVDHKPSVAEALFCEQLATDDSTFASYIAEQLGQMAVFKGQINANILNANLATVRAIGPQDEVETMLACQMAAVHLVTMATAASLTQGANGQHDLKVGQLNKLTRTFATQMEALKRYRSKGEQRITVEHVDVHDGGQAVVGMVASGT